MSNAPVNKRKSAPKGRLGCTTCKARHVRCDEAKPRCTPCQKSSRQCEYSAQTVRPGSTQLKVVLWQPNGLAARRLSSFPNQTSNEGRSLDFFRTKVAASLGGYFSSSFWTSDVLQAAQFEPSIRHAVVALASLSETMLQTNHRHESGSENGLDRQNGKESSVSRSPSPAPGTFAIKQHIKAVSTLQKTMQDGRKSSPEAVLLTCALFIGFEMIQNNYEAALRQMSSGVFVFCDWLSKQRTAAGKASPQSTALAYQLEKLFERLTLQTILFIDTNMQEWQFVVPAFTPPMPFIPPAFRSISEARDCLNALQFSIYHGTLTSQLRGLDEESAGNGDCNPDTISCEPNHIVASPRHEWVLAFEAFTDDSTTILSRKEQRAAILLKIQHMTGSILADTGLFKQEIHFDVFESTFAQIVSLASCIIIKKEDDIKNNSEAHSPSPTPIPAFDMGILPPLYFVASRCRHPAIRRQALRFLRQGPSQEGIWHAGMLYKIAERIMKLEEGDGFVGSSGDVGASARISVLNAKIDSGRRTVALHCCRLQARGEGMPSVLHERVRY